MNEPATQIKTLKVRVRDKHAPVLRAMAREVNFVWNYCNDLSYRMIRERRTFLNGFDFHPYTVGASREFDLIGSATIDEVRDQFAVKRNAAKRAKLRWRVSNPNSPKRSLGWVPFKGRAAKWHNGQVRFAGQHFKVWDSWGLSEYEFRAGSFSEDSRGRWYFNVCVKVPVIPSKARASVGIDLGLKDAATMSTGDVSEGREYRAAEQQLGIAQRAGKKDRVRAIHDKVKNRRKDRLHQLSHRLTRDNGLIVVGNVSSQAMIKRKKGFAKSATDAGWAMFKTILEAKAKGRQVMFIEVNEAFSTQACSSCGAISDNSPKGRAGLEIREWTCGDCGAEHQRDVNAAKNILAAGYSRLAGGIPSL